MVRGRDGLQEYRRRRRMETQRIPNFRVSDCFHDGNTTLSMVHEMHGNLIQDCGRSDHVTEAALTLMIKEMLEVRAGRPSAGVLYFKSERILSLAEEELAKHASRRVSGGTHAVRDSQISMNDRPRTPPQVPDGYLCHQPKTPQHHANGLEDRTSSSESMVYPDIENDHSVYNFNPPTTPVRQSAQLSAAPSQNEGHVLMTPQSYNKTTSGHDNESSISPSVPISSRYGYAQSSMSGAQRQGNFSSTNGRNNGRAGTFPVANPGHELRMLDRDLHSTVRNSGQCRFSSTSAAASPGGDASPSSVRPQIVRLTNRSSRSNAAVSEIAQIPLGVNSNEQLEMSSSTPEQRPPILSVPVAKKWKSDTKSGIRTSLPQNYLIGNLNKRDHVSQ